MEFNPVQTNQRPWKEKSAQRAWEVTRVILCYTTPFFMRKWRRCVTAIFARICGGGAEYMQIRFPCAELPHRLSLECVDWRAIKHW